VRRAGIFIAAAGTAAAHLSWERPGYSRPGLNPRALGGHLRLPPERVRIMSAPVRARSGGMTKEKAL